MDYRKVGPNLDKSRGNPSYIQYFTKDLYEILNCFYHVTGVSVGIYENYNHEISYCNTEQCAYCAAIQSVMIGWERCERLDSAACQAVLKTRTPCSYICHAGLCETVIPIFIKDFHVGYLVLGQYRMRADVDQNSIRKCADELSLDAEKLAENYARAPILSEEKLKHYTRLLTVLIDGIISEELIRFSRDDLLSTIMAYIDENIRGDLSAQALCKQFSISHSELYRIFKIINLTPHNYVLDRRMRLAYELLVTSPLSIIEISERVGCENYTYFLRRFRGSVGIPPGQLRKRLAAGLPVHEAANWASSQIFAR